MPLTRALLGVWLLSAPIALADEIATLPNTAPLTWEGELADRMMDGLHRFAERKIDESEKGRAVHWKRDFSSPDAYSKSIAPNRQRLGKILGIVDERAEPRMERFGDDDAPALVAETDRYRVFQVRWPVVRGVTGEGLLLLPKVQAVARVVALPDADQSPEQLVGLAPGIAVESQFARQLAENGVEVIVPVLVDRSDEWSGSDVVAYTNQPHREWLYRQSYHMGRHVIGYEVQKTLAAVDWFTKSRAGEGRVGVAGYGEGGLIALCAAALDPRIDACLVSGYFDKHQRPWEEPLYRNIWGLYREFGDAELATLVAPRGLVIEHSPFPKVDGPPAIRKGRRGGAALGSLKTPPGEVARSEFDRIGKLLAPGFQATSFIAQESGAPIGFGSPQAIDQFAKLLGLAGAAPASNVLPRDNRKDFLPASRQKRQVKEIEADVQWLVRSSDRVREQFRPIPAPSTPISLEEFVKESRRYRTYVWDDILGRFDDPLLPPMPRSRKIYDRDKWTGYDVTLDVFPDVFAWGVLLLPKDLKPGEKRPVVVCQHGRAGVPKDTVEGDHPAYHDFAAKLADRGYIVFAPHNPYRGEDRYRFLSRKANGVKASLFSFILAQHEQILNFLETLPSVDPQRIAFYGLSYGGETAVRVPPLLERYCLSICSADFNDWARKIASTDAKYTFMFTVEWEMPYFDMGSTFNYAELAGLMAPRPFMVERGHNDGVAPDEWVAYEYAKVRRLYDYFGLKDQTEIEFFDGPHTINGQGTFRFLDRHLRWPPAK